MMAMPVYLDSKLIYFAFILSLLPNFLPKTRLGGRMAFKRPSVQFCPAPPVKIRVYGKHRKPFFLFDNTGLTLKKKYCPPCLIAQGALVIA